MISSFLFMAGIATGFLLALMLVIVAAYSFTAPTDGGATAGRPALAGIDREKPSDARGGGNLLPPRPRVVLDERQLERLERAHCSLQPYGLMPMAGWTIQ